MLAILIIIFVVAADQLTKRWAADALQPVGSIPVIRNVLHLTYAENTGAAFSILKNYRWVFISLTSVVLVVILYLLFVRRLRRPLTVVALSMLAGGGIGNMIDRIGQGYVVDMIDFRLINFAIFNVADSFITVGTILFAILYLFTNGALEPAAKRPKKNSPVFYGAFRYKNSLSSDASKELGGHERD